MKRWAAACFALGLLAVIAIRFAEPILDGDLFWHMAYAQQMLARHTLIPDHAVYSWTPASNNMIYCAWLSELFFYGLWTHLGLASLFVFRYVCVLASMAMLWNYARKRGLATDPLTWLVLMIVLLGSAGGTILKPEIFSLVFFNAMVLAFFQWKRDRQARWLYAIPALMLVWVNTHGVFAMAAPFLLATFAGEALNRSLTRHLTIAWSLCGAAVLGTPYGWRYPWELLASARTSRPDIAWNDAHQSIFSAAGAASHFVELGVLMATVLLLVAIYNRQRDWSIVLANLVYVPLFIIYLRTTYYWPVVFGYSALHMAALGRPVLSARAWRAAGVALFVFLGGRACLDAWRTPEYGSWLGFGIGYVNPVPEAEFLAAANLGPRMYNLFDSGGYLLWRLYPQYRVMTDSRSFPYLAWFDDQYRFTLGQSVDDFMRRYPADTAVIDLLNKATWRSFLASPDWRPVFYGPTAAVFVKRSAPYRAELIAAPGEVRNAGAAFQVFDFAIVLGDFPTAWATLDQIETRLAFQASKQELSAARAYRDGHRALRAGDWDRARQDFDAAFKNKYVPDREQLIRFLLAGIGKLQAEGKGGDAATMEAGLKKLAAPE